MRLVAIEIVAHEVRIAWAERRFGGVRRLLLERRPALDPAAVGAVLAGVARRRPDVVVAVVPARHATHRLLSLPFRQRRRIERTVPLELLGQLPLDSTGEEVAVACEPVETTAAGSLVLAAAIRRADLDAHAALIAAAGLRPARLELAPLPAWNLVAASDHDLALVVADGDTSTVSVRRHGRLTVLRALGTSARDIPRFADEVRWSLAAVGGAARIVVAGSDGGGPLPDAVGAATGAAVVSLAEVAVPFARDQEQIAACAVVAGVVAGTARRRPLGLTLAGTRGDAPGSLRRAAALAALALGVAGIDVALTHHALARRDRALVGAIAAEAATALPGTPIVAARAQVEAAAAAALRREVRLGARTSVLEVLRDLSERVPPTIRLDLDEVAVDGETVVLHGRTDGFEAVDALRRALAVSPALADVAAEDTRSTVDGRRVEFRLRATRRAAAGASS